MIIILKKDGTVVTDDGNPVEGVKLENAAAILADPKDGDTIMYDATAGMWVAGTGGGSFEPDITNPQDGDTLVYDASEEKWVNGSGGGSVGDSIMFPVLVTRDDNNNYVTNVIFSEAMNAVTAGKLIFFNIDNMQSVYWSLVTVGNDEGFEFFAISPLYNSSSGFGDAYISCYRWFENTGVQWVKDGAINITNAD